MIVMKFGGTSVEDSAAIDRVVGIVRERLTLQSVVVVSAMAKVTDQLLAMAAALCWIFGWKAYLLLQLTIMMVAGSAGVWLFYVQHQFEGVYWQRREQWDYAQAALQGSSFYKLPRLLQWFSGNIGFHHIHHLSPRIPNYHLEKCHKAEPLFQTVKPVTLSTSMKSFAFRLWDEQRHKLVGFRALKAIRLERRPALAGTDRHRRAKPPHFDPGSR